jgi:hypothetical protein
MSGEYQTTQLTEFTVEQNTLCRTSGVRELLGD